MTYRSMDLQVSLPRVHETGVQQAQLQGRMALEARIQADASIRSSDAARQRAGEVEGQAKARIGYEPSGATFLQSMREERQQQKLASMPANSLL